MEVLVINAFAEDGLLGNPAGVCFVEKFPPDFEMLKTAARAGFSETAFVQKQKDGFFIRWWTPQIEVSLCGHATLAAAHAIWQNGYGEKAIRFFPSDYNLNAETVADVITMDFPSVAEEKCAKPEGLCEILGAEVTYTGKNRFDYLVELRNEGDVAGIGPDFEKLKNLDCRGVIVTSASEKDGYDFVSRFFAPRAGIDEDPVTGSAHCCLAPYWSEKTGKKKMKGLQISQRGGVVRTEIAGDRVKIGGKAVTDTTLDL